MLKINTAKSDMGVAWMLKHNGTAIPVKIHIYEKSAPSLFFHPWKSMPMRSSFSVSSS